MKNRFESSDDFALIRKTTDLLGDNSIEIMKTDIRKPEDLLKFRPKNSTLSETEWLSFVANFGIEKLLAKEFDEWRIDHPGTGNRFGSLEEDFNSQFREPNNPEKYKQFVEYIMSKFAETDLAFMGQFGQWANEAGFSDKILLKEVAKEHLED